MNEQLTQWERDERDAAFTAIRGLSDYVNKYHNINFLVEATEREHRTLQQCITNYMLRWLLHLAEVKEGWYDLRNEASVKIARQIKDAVPSIQYRLPLI